MKRVVLIFACLLYFASSFAQSRYCIYKIIGDVKLKKDNVWITSQKRMEISAIDVLSISQDAKVAILDNTSNRIFYSTKSGEQRVAGIINSAKKESDEITGFMNGQIKKAIAEKASKDCSDVTLGASYRGSSNSGNSESVYASLCDVISNYDNIKSTEIIRLQKNKKDDDEFYFIVENKSAYPLYVNVLQISETLQSPILCFNLGYSCDEPYMLIPPHKQVSVEHFVFANSSEDKNKYILFASEHPFDTQELQTLLNSNVKSTITTKDRLPVYIYSFH